MSDSSHSGPDPSRHFRHAPSDLEILRSHPSLAPLAARGHLLDRLPAASTGWAFGAAVLVSLLAFGAGGTVIPVLGITLAVALAVSTLLQQDLAAARAVLHVARVGMLVWTILGACFLGGPGPAAARYSPAPPMTSTADGSDDSTGGSTGGRTGGSTGASAGDAVAVGSTSGVVAYAAWRGAGRAGHGRLAVSPSAPRSSG